MQKFLKPALWIIGFQIISAMIGMVTQSGMPWYDTLEKSDLTPPDIAFPIVWTGLYVMLALAGYYVWNYAKTHGKDSKIFVLFWVQMLMNWGWSFVFFGLQMVFPALIWICALNLMMLALIIIAYRPLRIVSWLILPTLIWGCFAGYLNYMIWVLN